MTEYFISALVGFVLSLTWYLIGRRHGKARALNRLLVRATAEDRMAEFFEYEDDRAPMKVAARIIRNHVEAML